MESAGFLVDRKALYDFGESLIRASPSFRIRSGSWRGTSSTSIRQSDSARCCSRRRCRRPAKRPRPAGARMPTFLKSCARQAPDNRGGARIPHAHKAQIHLRGRAFKGHIARRQDTHKLPDDRYGHGGACRPRSRICRTSPCAVSSVPRYAECLSHRPEGAR